MKRPLSKQTKIQRYKQIEKEIEHDRRIRQDEMKIIEEIERQKRRDKCQVFLIFVNFKILPYEILSKHIQ